MTESKNCQHNNTSFCDTCRTQLKSDVTPENKYHFDVEPSALMIIFSTKLNLNPPQQFQPPCFSTFTDCLVWYNNLRLLVALYNKSELDLMKNKLGHIIAIIMVFIVCLLLVSSGGPHTLYFTHMVVNTHSRTFFLWVPEYGLLV